MTAAYADEDAERARYDLERARVHLLRAAESLSRTRRGYRLALDSKAEDLALAVADMLAELTS